MDHVGELTTSPRLCSRLGMRTAFPIVHPSTISVSRSRRLALQPLHWSVPIVPTLQNDHWFVSNVSYWSNTDELCLLSFGSQDIWKLVQFTCCSCRTSSVPKLYRVCHSLGQSDKDLSMLLLNMPVRSSASESLDILDTQMHRFCTWCTVID